MNCLDFRRRILSDPYASDPELVQHEYACTSCAPFAADVRDQEQRLGAAVNAIALPPGLVDQLVLDSRLERGAQRRRLTWFASAASVLLAVVFSFWHVMDTQWDRSQMRLAQSVIDHIQDEATHLRSPGPAPTARVNAVFERFGASVQADLGRVNFAGECLMRQRNGVHLVLAGQAGPVTVFYMPGEMIGDEIAVESDRFQGLIRPTAWGSLAVIGEAGEADLHTISERMAQAVAWPAAERLASDLVWRNLSIAPRIAQQ